MGLFNATEISVEQIERDYRQALLPGERVVAAFKAIRDTVFLTERRFVVVDVQGMTGKKICIQSIPWSKISGFSVETAGTFDMDADLKLFVSGIGVIEVKIGRNSDSAAIQRLLAQYICG